MREDIAAMVRDYTREAGSPPINLYVGFATYSKLLAEAHLYEWTFTSNNRINYCGMIVYRVDAEHYIAVGPEGK